VPPSQVQDRAGASALQFVRFQPQPAAGDGLEVEMLVVARAGPPVSWSVAQGVAPSQAHADEPPDAVQCGVPFTIEVEARDEHGNRCVRRWGL